MTRLDVRNPLVLDTRDLSRRAGSMLEVRRTVPAPERIGTDVVAVPQGAPLELDLRLESVSEGVLVTGTVLAQAQGSCVRCLEPVAVPVRAEFTELFAYPDTRASRRAHRADAAHPGDSHEPDDLEQDEVHELVGDLLDLEPVVRDAAVPSLPFQPVCRPDCPGLCSQCGALLAQDPGHHHASVDPRWASLRVLLDAEPAAGGDTPTDHHPTPEKRN